MSQGSHQGTNVWTTLDVAGWGGCKNDEYDPTLARLGWLA